MTWFKTRLLPGLVTLVMVGVILGNFTVVLAAAPTIANPISNQSATENAAFNFTFSASTFNDSDGDMLTYSAQLNGGGALPAWLNFNASTRTFSGTPSNGDTGTISIDVIADDGEGGTVTDTFDIVINAIGVTAQPIMDAPANNATYGTIPVDFALGENPLTNSIRLIFVGTSTITINLHVGNPATGPYEYSINPTDIMATGAPILSSSQNTIPDGTYSVTLTYQNASGDPAASTTATNVTVNSALVDTDGDGSLDSVEDAGPNNGDANGDGTADRLQANVHSYLNSITSEYAVLETDCERIENFQIGSESSQQPDPDYDYPMGLASFWIHCANAGDTALIRHYYYGVQGSELYSVRKWMNDGSYREIPGGRPLGALVDDTVVFLTEYEITDGSEFDDDGVEDAVIRDPSGAALLAATTPDPTTDPTPSANSNSNSPLARTGQNTQTILAAILLLVGSSTLIVARRLHRKQSR